MTHSRRAVHDLLRTHGLAPRRDLGQNFVADANTVRRIAHLAGVGPGDRVVEIGAGLGSLTLALIETGADVTAIEVDRGLAAALREVVHADTATGHEPGAVRVVEADALHLDWPALLGAQPWVLVANLPYNVATPLVCDVLDRVPSIERMLIMVQREVAERLTARPRTRAYGAVSVKVAYWADARLVGLVPASVFVPRPNVESSLVDIRRHVPPRVDADRLFELVRAGFAHRRQMLRRTLSSFTIEQFSAAAVDPTARPEELDLAAWVRLADLGGEGPEHGTESAQKPFGDECRPVPGAATGDRRSR